MALFSGKDGQVKVGTNQVGHVTKWTAETSANIDKVGTSDSSGWKDGAAGSKDIKGTIEGKFADSGNALFEEGDTVALELLTDSETSPKGKMSGNALIASIGYEVDVDTGALVGFTANWEGIGAWTKTGVFAKSG